jgi:release factor glutamine methyltransferase
VTSNAGTASLFQLVVFARERLARAGISPGHAAVDAEVLARAAAGWDRAAYLARRDEPASGTVATRFEAFVRRREAREPVAYILGTREFWGLDFLVTPAVLIPRPETEFIVEAALARLTDRARRWRIGDVGTGSGCLAVALAVELPHAQVTAIDISPEALEVAHANAGRHGVADRVTFARTSLLDGVDGPFDLIVANPPYVPRALRPGLSPDVRDHEPDAALYGGGDDGLDEIRALLAQAPSRLAPDGWLQMEFGFAQGDAVRAAVASAADLELVEILCDLQGLERTLVAKRPAVRSP